MVTRTASLRLQLIDTVSGPAKHTTAALSGLERNIASLGKKGAPGAKNLVGQLEYLRKKAVQVGQFKELRAGMKQTAEELRQAKIRVDQLKTSIAGMSKPSDKMRRELRSAEHAVRMLGSSFREQAAAARRAEIGLRSFGLNSRSAIMASQNAIRSQMAQTIQKMREFDREARKSRPPRGGGTRSVAADAIIAAGGTVAVNTGKSAAHRAVTSSINFDQAYMRRDAIGQFTAQESSRLNEQAKRIGQATEFENIDIVAGQKRVLQAGIRNATQIETLTESVVQYARAMEVSVEQAAQSLTAMALVKQVDLNDQKAVRNLVDRAAWASKNSGMEDEDLVQYNKYAGPSGKAAGLPDDYLMAAAMVLKRAGIRGDEAGVAIRSAASKLVSPTSKGRDSLNTMGLNYNDYVASPDAFSVVGFEKGLKERFGFRVNDAVREALKNAWEAEYTDGESGELITVASDMGEFVTRTSEALKSVTGEMKARDAEKLATYIGRFHQMSAESVDIVRLFDDILKVDPTLIQANALFTERQGNRLALIAKNRKGFEQAKDTIRNTPDGIAQKIGDDAMKGLYGDYERMAGSINNAILKIGQDWEGPIRKVAVGIDQLADGFTNLSEKNRRLIEAAGAAVIALAGFAAWRSGMGLLGRMIGGGAAGSASSVAAGTAAGGILGNMAKGSMWKKGAGAFGLIGAAYSADQFKKEAMGPSSVYAPSLFDVGSLTGGAMQHWFKKAQEPSSPAPGTDLSNKIQSEMQNWPIAAQQGIQGYLQALTNGGAEAEVKAQQIADETKRILSFEANPTVATASLERALDLARQLAAVLRTERTGGGSTNVSGSTQVGGTRAAGGPVQKGKTYAVGGSGVELFTAGADGFVTPTQSGSGLASSGGIYAPVTIHMTVEGGAGGSQIAEMARVAKQAVEQAFKQLDHELGLSSDTTFANLTYGDR